MNCIEYDHDVAHDVFEGTGKSVFDVGAFTLGYVRELATTKSVNVAVGMNVTTYALAGGLKQFLWREAGRHDSVSSFSIARRIAGECSKRIGGFRPGAESPCRPARSSASRLRLPRTGTGSRITTATPTERTAHAVSRRQVAIRSV
jgi:hypothetical protein